MIFISASSRNSSSKNSIEFDPLAGETTHPSDECETDENDRHPLLVKKHLIVEHTHIVPSRIKDFCSSCTLVSHSSSIPAIPAPLHGNDLLPNSSRPPTAPRRVNTPRLPDNQNLKPSNYNDSQTSSPAMSLRCCSSTSAPTGLRISK